MAGERFEEYVLDKKLGDGPSAEVWTVSTSSNQRERGAHPAALKILRPEVYARSPTAYDALARTLDTLSGIQHPAIAAGRRLVRREEDGLFGLLFDYYAAESFESIEIVGDPRQPFAPNAMAGLLRLMEDLCSCLSFLHRHGIVHGNVKPANVLIVHRPEGHTTKLLDLAWSASRAFDPSPHALRFLPPELRRERRSPTPSCDQWAVAKLLSHVFVRSAREQPAAVALRRAPPFLLKVLKRALEDDPALRFGSMAAFVEALAETREELEVSLLIPEARANSSVVEAVADLFLPEPDLLSDRPSARSEGSRRAEAMQDSQLARSPAPARTDYREPNARGAHPTDDRNIAQSQRSGLIDDLVAPRAQGLAGQGAHPSMESPGARLLRNPPEHVRPLGHGDREASAAATPRAVVSGRPSGHRHKGAEAWFDSEVAWFQPTDGTTDLEEEASDLGFKARRLRAGRIVLWVAGITIASGVGALTAHLLYSEVDEPGSTPKEAPRLALVSAAERSTDERGVAPLSPAVASPKPSADNDPKEVPNARAEQLQEAMTKRDTPRSTSADARGTLELQEVRRAQDAKEGSEATPAAETRQASVQGPATREAPPPPIEPPPELKPTQPPREADAEDPPAVVAKESTASPKSPEGGGAQEPADRCAGGDTEACFDAAERLDASGQDLRRARSLYEKACDATHARACAQLGDMWRLGRGGVENERTGDAFKNRACRLGLRKACVPEESTDP